MKKIITIGITLLLFLPVFAQKDSIKPADKVLIVPYQEMMFFSDADQDMARFSRSNERNVRTDIRNNLEVNVYHQLLVICDAISLMRSTTYNSDEDLKRIYASTRYAVYSRAVREEFFEKQKREKKSPVKSLMGKFKKKSKDQAFWVNDSNTMLAVIDNPEIFQHLTSKYHEQYILFITQFEINTSNKNSIEWTVQKYTREYILHYNLFDKSGNLIRAETLTLKGGNENTMKEVNDKYLILIAQRLREILAAVRY
ncbi:MAG: hypothetical protein ACHQK8_02365 [Bacteroidia bacterium]